MKRLWTTLIFLLLGAVMNVGVAWGCAVFVNVETAYPATAFRMTEGRSWELIRLKSFGSTHYYSTHGIGDSLEADPVMLDYMPSELAPSWGDVTHPSESALAASGSAELVIDSREVDGRGWPLRALWCVRGTILEYGDYRDSTGVQGAIITPLKPWRYLGVRVLPYLPIWPGIIFNTFFYAVILWLLFPGRRILRSRFRRNRGLCEKCDYDLRGIKHEACPECGTVVKVKPA